MEPEYIAQTAELTDQPQVVRREWVEARYAEARGKGMTWMRTSWLDDPAVLLVEGWRDRPADEGEPRFMITAG